MAGTTDLVHHETSSPLPGPETARAAAPRVLHRHLPPSPPSWARRTVDVVGSITLVVLLSPFLLAVALAVLLTSPGPIIYRQTRVGINRRAGAERRTGAGAAANADRRRSERRVIASSGRLFRIMKFRTMVDGAESTRGPIWASKNDARITPVGKFLRRTRIDELPQLLNVLSGDMTFIGPRPERPFFVERFRRVIPSYVERLTVPPGITGLAQVEHKYDASVEDVRLKLEFDLRYLRNRGLFQDLKILVKTVLVVFSGAGAH